ncbi:proton-coupled zinc antiporter SLC30A9, mitochondrial [Macrosteles quadrilineatus]|uniref:proton-coupled zinc antiporter SLC30A9, mitochondrial n=1 Tax=Macrosteles quadrilineatus TaxID=74068 RepID=UPI0023E0FD71|nr:proton-coupled zinc antiporter SLC30A9, mitochondrial [Macrosteles quadrilineatus]
MFSGKMMKRPDIARKILYQYTSKIFLEPVQPKVSKSKPFHNGCTKSVVVHYRTLLYSVRSLSSDKVSNDQKVKSSSQSQPDPLNPDVKVIEPTKSAEDKQQKPPKGDVPGEKPTAKAVLQEFQEDVKKITTMEKETVLATKTKKPDGKPDPFSEKEKKKSIIQEAVEKVTKKRMRVDLTATSVARNFITPVRAMSDFLLKPSDLENLRATKRRSPYENEPPITVYWRKDVEEKAFEVWGSKEILEKELLKRDLERRFYQQSTFTAKRRLRDFRRERDHQRELEMAQEAGLFGPSGRVVLTAIAINGSNFLFKTLACAFTGSHVMFSEAVHSLADTINQLILAYGIHKSVQRADSDHPYGYTNMKYVSSLISGVGIFCIGTGLSLYHGVMGLVEPSDLVNYYWALLILGGSLASEGATLLVAYNNIKKGAEKCNMTFSEYVLRGTDPSVNVVLLEDCAAVVGVATAGVCLMLSSYFNSHIPDAIGSLIVGGILGCVASFIIYTNIAALVGRSIPHEYLEKINMELESDVMIRAIHDVKGIDMGNSLIRYKAEVDFDGRELTRSYLDKQDLNTLLEEVKNFKNIDEFEGFMLKHSENIVDMMGGEIDRIEMKLRKKFPDVRHCDLEIL